ncbi:zinc-binding dehydrogenase [Janibacter indicus]|uniref:Zinc-binding dehydrogenase n=1 Tax=Janibacter indicus TaxID=857417 RepID=A0A7L9J4C6_9MICO|nr:zinc-binding dehydrogenase [Janibacter indicus]QOK24047.1 zinc-binding dehydrogenase [Janibacter indicus]
MRAATRSRYGGPDVLRHKTIPDPTPGPGELLVRVHATTVNRTDTAYRSGRPWINRLVCGWPRPRVTVLGSEYSGVVEALGEGVPVLHLAAASPVTRRLGRRHVRFPYPRATTEVAADLERLLASSAYRPVVDRTYGFDELCAAHTHVDTGRKVGSVVVRAPQAKRAAT